MEISLSIHGIRYKADLTKPLNIGLPLLQDSNPNCYYTEPMEITTIKTAGFIGSIADGGIVNHKKLSIAPHGNGTHTECSGHIYNNAMTIHKVIDETHFPAQLISLYPDQNGATRYISAQQMEQVRFQAGIRALVIRTLPNDAEKETKNYSGTNPPFVSEPAMQKIVDMGIEHLIIDLPSVDPEVDEGKLAAHKIFWQGSNRQKHCTVTELAYIPNDITDGIYLLNLQTLRIELDVSPSNPVLYSLKTI